MQRLCLAFEGVFLWVFAGGVALYMSMYHVLFLCTKLLKTGMSKIAFFFGGGGVEHFVLVWFFLWGGGMGGGRWDGGGYCNSCLWRVYVTKDFCLLLIMFFCILFWVSLSCCYSSEIASWNVLVSQYTVMAAVYLFYRLS